MKIQKKVQYSTKQK